MKDAAALLVLNTGLLVAGRGALRALRVQVGTGAWYEQLGIWYFTGALSIGVVASEAAVLRIPVGLPLALVAAGALVVVGEAVARRAAPRPRRGRGRPAAVTWRALEIALLAVVAMLVVATVAASLVSPLEAWDGWAIWGARSHALFASGTAWDQPFTSDLYVRQHLEYPLLLPALEALSLDSLGRFDVSLVDIQPTLLYASFPFALWGLLRASMPGWLAALAPLPIITVPELRLNLSWNYADTMVALIVAMALVCVLLWLERGEPELLHIGAVFLAASCLIKNDGLALAIGIVVAGVLVAPRCGRRRTPLIVAGSAAVAASVPWWVFLQIHGISGQDYRFADLARPGFLADRAWRIPPTASELLDQLASSWRIPTAIGLLAVVAALAAGRYALAGFVTVWAVSSLAVLTCVFWISRLPLEQHLSTAAGRVVGSVAVGVAAAAPVLGERAWAAVARPRPPSEVSPAPPRSPASPDPFVPAP